MRILCLHGVGSSGSILESQLNAFVKAADPSYEFVFADGPYPSAKGPERTSPDNGYPGLMSLEIDAGMEAFDDDEPCWSHTESYSPAHMSEALDSLQDTIEDLGPFKCVIGFSQGAATAISYLLRQQERGEALSFEFAMCFSSVLAVSGSPDYADTAIRKLASRKLDFTSTIDLGALETDERALADVITRIVKPAKDHHSMLPDFDLNVYTNGDKTEAPKIMVAALLDKKLAIPTVHITGKRDANWMRDMSEVTRGLCSENTMKVLEHAGGHQPPQDSSSVRAAIGAMEWAIVQAQKNA